jgi:hypothetical protein
MNPRRRRHQRVRRRARATAQAILDDLRELQRACAIDYAAEHIVWVRDVDTGEEGFMRAADAERLRVVELQDAIDELVAAVAERFHEFKETK